MMWRPSTAAPPWLGGTSEPHYSLTFVRVPRAANRYSAIYVRESGRVFSDGTYSPRQCSRRNTCRRSLLTLHNRGTAASNVCEPCVHTANHPIQRCSCEAPDTKHCLLQPTSTNYPAVRMHPSSARAPAPFVNLNPKKTTDVYATLHYFLFFQLPYEVATDNDEWTLLELRYNDDVAELRDSTGADLVQLMSDLDDSCGRG